MLVENLHIAGFNHLFDVTDYILEMIMKKFGFLFFALFLLVGCGLESTVENTTSSMRQANVPFVEYEAATVWTDMRPISNTPQAGVVFEVETTLKSGEAITLYGGGTLTVGDGKFAFEDDSPILGKGAGVVRVYEAASKGPDDVDSMINMPRVIGLTAQIDGIQAELTDISIEGIVVSRNAKEETLEFPGVVELDMQEVGCYGRFLPNSTFAQFIVLWESENRIVNTGGLIELGKEVASPSAAPDLFSCTIGSKAIAASTDVSMIDANGGVMLIEMENVSLNFDERDNTYQIKNSNAILFFDEADSLFGKLHDGNRDKYANQEVSYLRQLIGLQR